MINDKALRKGALFLVVILLEFKSGIKKTA